MEGKVRARKLHRPGEKDILDNASLGSASAWL